MPAPVLDRRSYDDLVAAVLAAARRTAPEWRPPPGGDVGTTLVRIYAHYLELLLERLNRVPEKQLVAFLELLGAALLPPGTARAPLTFALAPTAGSSGFVPRGTQAATVQTETSPAVVFETQADLVVTAAQLASAITIDPVRDRYTDQTEATSAAEGIVFRPFHGELPLAHTIYLGVPAWQPFLEAVPGRLTVIARGGTAAYMQKLEWQIWRDGMWQDLSAPQASGDPGAFGRTRFEGVRGSSGPLELSVSGLPAPPTARWLRAYPTRTLAELGAPPPITRLELLAETSERAIVVERTATESSFEVWFGSDTVLGPDALHAHLGLNIDFPELDEDWVGLSVAWRGWNGTAWQMIGVEAITRGSEPYSERLVADTTRGIQRSGWVTFARPSWLTRAQPDPGVAAAYWIKADAKLDTGKTANWAARVLDQRNWGTSAAAGTAGTFGAHLASSTNGTYKRPPRIRDARFARELALDAGATGTGPLDVSRPFEPFGGQPRLGDVVYLASREAFAQPGARAVVFFALERPGRPAPHLHDDFRTTDDFQLQWEYYGARGWTRLGTTTIQFLAVWPQRDGRAQAKATGLGSLVQAQAAQSLVEIRRARVKVDGVHDSTEAFSRDGELVFDVPADIAETSVGGVSSFWIRAVVAAGSYGSQPEYIPIPSAQLEPAFVLRPGTGGLAPPLVRSAAAAYDYRTPLVPALVTCNGFDAVDLTADNRAATIAGPLLVPVEEPEPTLYLGFDRKPDNDAVNLYVEAPARTLVEPLVDVAAQRQTGEPRLVWEYWNGAAWTTLVVVDGTARLTESGTIGFLAPEDMTELAKFELPPRWWLRVRRVEGSADYDPALNGLFLNTVEALQAATVTRVVAGSGTGRRSQTVTLAGRPVLPGQRIVVREPERPPAPEEEAARAAGGEDAVQLLRTAAGVEEVWVRWHEVDTLVRSGPRDRHYTIDRIGGVVQFGNGVHGLVVPEGKDNVVVELARSGGGPGGNQPAGAISQLKTSIPYVASVRNPIPSAGGSSAETTSAALVRGPQALRNRGRAVAADDFEWLARAASGTAVARAMTLPARDGELQRHEGWVTLMIVPDGSEPRLAPSPELVREVEDALAAHAAATLTRPVPEHVVVVGPSWVPVELRAEVMPVSFTEAEAMRGQVLDRIREFLHPLRGGPGRGGWELGRDVFLSELYAELESLPDVEHVHALRVKPNAAALPLLLADEHTARAGWGAGSGVVRAEADRPRVVAVLVAPIPPATRFRTLQTALFREGEGIRIAVDGDEEPVETFVRTVTGTTLAIEPFRARHDLPAGTAVTAAESPARSVLTAEIAAGTLVTQLSVQGFEPGDSVVLRGWEMPLPLATEIDGAVKRLRLGESIAVPSAGFPYSGFHTVEPVQD